MRREPHDVLPPQNWPDEVQYLTKSRLAATFPPVLIPLLYPASHSPKFNPSPANHSPNVLIKPVKDPKHPANGQNGLFAKRKISPGELITPYLGIIHASLVPIDTLAVAPRDSLVKCADDESEESDYDLCLLSLSAGDLRNPFQPDYHVSIGVDAAKSGNAGRMVNDYRGIGTSPNAEFKVGKGMNGELRMEIWSLQHGKGISKGEEVLVSYGKGWWNARRGAT